MANPQAENGHIDVANEVAEKLARFQLSGTEHRILWAVWRKTWGWHKKEDRISISQLVKMTELKRRSVRRALENLVKKNIIIKNFARDKNAPTSINYLRFNKDYETWITRDKIAPWGQKRAQNYAQKCAPQKKRKKNNKPPENLNREHFDLVDLLSEKMLQNDPNAKVPNTKGKRENWARDFKLLVENDKRQIQEVREVLIWCQEHTFWRSNILSARKFRKQYPRLRLQKEENQNKEMTPEEFEKIQTEGLE